MQSTISRTSTRLSDELQSFQELSRPPSLSRLYSEAAEFEQFLARSGCMASTTSISEDNSFATLIGCDLAESEVAMCRLDRRQASIQDAFVEDAKQYEHAVSKMPAVQSVAPPKKDMWCTDPKKLVDMMIDEFGSLTDGGERLILETDGCLIDGVVVMGALHLTTLRFAFHATLCTCPPDLSTSHQVLKSGVATLHRKNRHSRRRVWLELTSDMLSAYRSSSGERKLQPLRSILLGLVDHVDLVNTEHSACLELVLSAPSQAARITFEFDTSRSALEWRRELSGVLFLYRHQRRAFMDNSECQVRSIRLSFPLDRIDMINSDPILDVLTRISLHVSFMPSDITTEEGNLLGAQILQFGVLRSDPLVSQLGRSIAAAKHHLNVDMSKSPLFMDLGPCSISEQEVRSTVTCSDLATKRGTNVRPSETESILWLCPAHRSSAVQSSGYLVLTPAHIGFWDKDLTRCHPNHYVSLHLLEFAQPFRTPICHTNGLLIRLRDGRKSIKLAFNCPELRDEAMRRVNTNITLARGLAVEKAFQQANYPSLRRTHDMTGAISPLSRSLATVVRVNFPLDIKLRLPKTVNIPPEVIGKRPPLHFMCLTIGSRGDVQPYIALGLGLKQYNHRVTIVTHGEYKNWVEHFGIEHRTAGGDPGRLMKLSVENKMFSPEFFRKTFQDFRSWLDELLIDAWNACQDAEVLLESPSTMAGIHIAEALKIPYFSTFTMPWTKTSEFPHPFLSPPGSPATFNSASNVIWHAISGQVNRWRRQILSLNSTEMGYRAQSKLVHIYNFSQAIVPKPLDWGDNIVISGYWFLKDAEVNWTPPLSLLKWMEDARRNNKPIVYIGFGSITVPRPNRVTAQIVKAVTRSGVWAIISKGWSRRMANVEDIPEVTIPSQCYVLDKVPHDWLFPRIDAAMHHGGAGTTGASLRAGIPTLIRPWFGDQFFWASRVEKLGAGIKINSFRAGEISEALIRATTDQPMKEKAAHTGTKIRSVGPSYPPIGILKLPKGGWSTHSHIYASYVSRQAMLRTVGVVASLHYMR
ncbi:hypothetical protein AX15_000137 [Amanita polypyramis BW_CC]|nr:hypothetical protein AX15_000137 [Amanita polypyramis BW_CC]